MRSATSCLAALVFLILFQPAAADTAWQGRKLSDYLEFLNGQGANIIYTSDLVAGDMLLSREPADDVSADTIAGLLQPFGLTLKPGPADSQLVVRRPAAVESAAEPAVDVEVAIPEIVVTSSPVDSHRSPFAGSPCPDAWRE